MIRGCDGGLAINGGWCGGHELLVLQGPDGGGGVAGEDVVTALDVGHESSSPILALESVKSGVSGHGNQRALVSKGFLP